MPWWLSIICCSNILPFHIIAFVLTNKIQFQPNLIIVSAGYDAAFGCPEVKTQYIWLICFRPVFPFSAVYAWFSYSVGRIWFCSRRWKGDGWPNRPSCLLMAIYYMTDFLLICRPHWVCSVYLSRLLRVKASPHQAINFYATNQWMGKPNHMLSYSILFHLLLRVKWS